MTYTCSRCGEVHHDLPDLSFDRPGYASSVPDDEFEKRVRLSEDLCVVDDQFYFIRGVLKIPIHESEQDLGFGIWVSQKKENFETNYETYDKNPHTGEWSAAKRFRGSGKEHGGVEPPLVLDRAAGKGPGSKPVVPRKPEPSEIPKGY